MRRLRCGTEHLLRGGRARPQRRSGRHGDAKRRSPEHYAEISRKGVEARIRVQLDAENGCEQCHETLRRLEPGLPVLLPEEFEISRSTWRSLKRCKHGAPDFARGIVIRVSN